MLSIPANTSWIERDFSTLEMICQKRRSKLGVTNLAALFLTQVLRIPRKSVLDYQDEIDLLASGGDALKKNLFRTDWASWAEFKDRQTESCGYEYQNILYEKAEQNNLFK